MTELPDAVDPIDDAARATPQSLTDTLRRADTLVFVADLTQPELSPDDLHHLRNVLRLAGGAKVIAADGKGSFRNCLFSADAERSRSKPRSRQRRVEENVASDQATTPDLIVDGEVVSLPAAAQVTVGFALVKGDRNDWAVQKLTELGVDRVVPLVADRSVVRLDESGANNRAERFRRIAREASMQSRRPALPVIDDPVSFADFIASLAPSALSGTAIAEPGGAPLTSDVHTILIGPEGGWSDAELQCNLRSIDLGSTILRAETAAIAAGVRLVAQRTNDQY